MNLIRTTKPVDQEKEYSERKLTLAEFLEAYNKDIPASFHNASRPTLNEFKNTYPALFKGNDEWSLDRHRKKYMDWLPQHLKF